MIDIAIIGGGLCGLALANQLTGSARTVRVFEARERLGGRIVTHKDPGSGLAVDLGATWIWPDSQPLIMDLLADLGLSTVEQYDTGDVLALLDPEEGVRGIGSDPVHNGAHRVDGGMGRVIAQLARRLPEGTVQTGQALTRLEDHDDHLVLSFHSEAGIQTVQARRVVLAIPPRLVRDQITFVPEVPAAVAHAMTQTATWMATQAKAVMVYGQAGWRQAGQSGAAFINHERAVLSEIFDLSDRNGVPGALGGFLALAPQTRTAFADGLPMLLGNQMGQVFGSRYEQGTLAYKDWAEDAFTCTHRDKAAPAVQRQVFGHALLRRAQWGGKLFFAGSETAPRHAGHAEGALVAAARLAGLVTRDTPAICVMPTTPETFSDWLQVGAERAFEDYQRILTRLLSQQDPEEATRRATADCLAALLEDALLAVQGLAPVPSQAADRVVLLERLKPIVRSALSQVIGQVVQFNRGSCALRFAPQEHSLPDAYVALILQDAGHLGREFFNEADALLVALAEVS